MERPSDVDSHEAFLKSIYKNLALTYPKFYKMDTLCKATFLAVELLQKEVDFSGTNTPLIWANHTGSDVSDQLHSSQIFSSEGSASPATFVYTLPNIAMGEISIRHQLHSENVFFIFEHFDPRWTLPLEQYHLLQNNTRFVLGGWIEANNDRLDVFIYVVGQQKGTPHTIAHLTTLYNEL
jgi:hypothetical protein